MFIGSFSNVSATVTPLLQFQFRLNVRKLLSRFSATMVNYEQKVLSTVYEPGPVIKKWIKFR